MKQAKALSEEQEAEFQADLIPEKLRIIRESNLFCIGLYSLFGLLDLWSQPSELVLTLKSLAAVAAFNLVVIAVSMSRYQDQIARHYRVITSVQYLIWAASMEWLILLASPADPAPYTYHAGLILISTAIYSWTYLSRGLALALSGSLAATYLVMTLGVQEMASPSKRPFLLSNCLLLCAANIVGFNAQGTRDRFARGIFLRKRALRRDLEKTEDARLQSDYLAEHDALTNLHNRHGLMRSLEAMLALARTRGEVVGGFFIDLDGFKQINDTHGHAAGDLVLKIVAHRLQTSFKATDIRARLGGDEFVIALNFGIRTNSEAEQIVEVIKAKIGSLITGLMRVDGRTFAVGASVGAALFPLQAGGTEGLLAIADRRMYDAKRLGTPHSDTPGCNGKNHVFLRVFAPLR